MSDSVVRCSECGLKNVCLPKRLTEQEIQALSALVASNHLYRRGDYLYRGGDKFSDLVILKSGSAKSELMTETGITQIVGFHFPGDMLGLEALVAMPTPSSVTFLEHASVCMIPAHAFNGLCGHAPQLYKEIITRLNAEVACMKEWMMCINNHSAEQRLAVFLLNLSHRQKSRGLANDYLLLSMSRNEIGNYLGLASSTVSRIFTKLERSGLVKVKNRHLQLLDYPALLYSITADSDCDVMASSVC